MLCGKLDISFGMGVRCKIRNQSYSNTKLKKTNYRVVHIRINNIFQHDKWKYSRLSLSRSPRDSLKYVEISVPRHIRFAELRKKLNRTTTFHKWICNLIPEIRDLLKILWKRGDIAPEEQYLPFSTIFGYQVLMFKQGPCFHFEISSYSR